ncbi:type III-B CRISPR module RAMP protein Cmr6 [Candidatus Nitrospira inopinata]|jgi:CRISPR-associated protein Cmr6|uniref:CRISPR type III-B/RAMP module RAMP protein Cmr6 n=1 Tax=Candidatus Nitrospira inopinata TaxID=1715989 RepID=A0A0S4KRP8_9BACT|nr:type III-B CRISPR module RAMP protein Cmr6 [Candidatus Nitrospira inopinata]CUQ66013.1 CRISPR type III-B/RAMP module RAMP protein Cmr6 [Candidatus Nitrospira inopinata]
MPIAAVPAYLGNDFNDASPALRFGMYLKLWGINRRTKALLWTTHDVDHEVRGQDRREREVRCENKTDALKQSSRLTERDKAANTSLVSRQFCGAAFLPPARLLRLDATATAPFTTGLGNEHPLENGFAFLNPYGLPYLPGSGVKGVLRQAAQELANGQWDSSQGWSADPYWKMNVGTAKDPRWLELSMLDVLFGRETPAGDPDHVRGALSFWDVIPQIAGDSLMVEIMTPHQSHYYQKKAQAGSTTPHDSGQPNPICFLTVPPGSRFTFHVVCDEQHLKRLTSNKKEKAPDLLAEGETHWKKLLESAFQHAFQWLGFGAKTAVGYGAMQAVESAASTPTLAQQGTTPATAPQPKSATPSVQSKEEQWTNVMLTYSKGGGGMITVSGSAGKAEARGAQAQSILKSLTPEQAKRLEKKGSLTNLTVLVEIEGNLRTVKAVVPEASTH